MVPTSNGGSQTTSSSATTRPSASRSASAAGRRRLVDRARIGDAGALHARGLRGAGDDARLEPADAVDLDRDARPGASQRRAGRAAEQQHVARRERHEVADVGDQPRRRRTCSAVLALRRARRRRRRGSPSASGSATSARAITAAPSDARRRRAPWSGSAAGSELRAARRSRRRRGSRRHAPSASRFGDSGRRCVPITMPSAAPTSSSPAPSSMRSGAAGQRPERLRGLTERTTALRRALYGAARDGVAERVERAAMVQQRRRRRCR